MRIQHNIMAMSAYRNYTNNVSAMKKNLEKLSSGYKINRAGDDAAGLAISEKMRAQITGLETAKKNAKDGISLVQTAEGALTEVHDMLNRMVELATQSANGTYEDTTDRNQMEKELKQLRDEIDRIADSSNFNGIKLFNGDMDSSPIPGTPSDVAVTAVRDGLRGTGDAEKGEYTFDLKDMVINAKTTIVDTTTGETSFVGATITVTVGTKTVGQIALTKDDFDSDTGKWEFDDALFTPEANAVSIGGQDFSIAISDGKVTLTGQATPTSAIVSSVNSTAFAVALEGTSDVANINNGWDQSVHAVKPVAIADADKLAHGSFQLTAANIKDGATITIGEDTYTFRVGSDSKVAAGDKVIDLSKCKATDTDLHIKAANLLAKQSNKLFDISAPTNDGTVHLNEKKGALTDYSKWDLTGAAKSATSDATWKNLDDVAASASCSSVVRLTTAAVSSTKAGLTLQIGDTAESFNQLKISLGDMHCTSLKGKNGTALSAISIANQKDAQKAVDVIKDAINQVSDVRGTLGAMQNRLDHTINNLSVMTENIQDAESTIRDVDVAEEMMAYTKNNILIQSAQAMLAQANQVPQGVLQLLQ